MLVSAIVLFVIAALFGLILLTAILQDRQTNKHARLLHGAFAATALVLVIIYFLINGSSPLLIASLSLLILAALGGLTLSTIDMKGKKIPKLLAVLHPVLALIGVIVLIIYVLP